MPPAQFFEKFDAQFTHSLITSANDIGVVGFKSVVCYRTGLDVVSDLSEGRCTYDAISTLKDLIRQYQQNGCIRLAIKGLNDHVVRTTLKIAGNHQKPGILSIYKDMRIVSYEQHNH
jgi:hypothetical protein